MRWAIGSGLVVGRGQGGKVFLVPRDRTPRCELATILARFIPAFEAEEENGDPLFRIADELNGADPCGEHGAVLHIQMGSPADVSEYSVGAAIAVALGLDPSIYDVTFADGSFDPFPDTYGSAKNGEFVTARLSFEIDNVRTTDGPAAFGSLPVAFLRNDRYSAPRCVRCDTDKITDEELAAKLGELDSLFLCPEHGCAHLEAEELNEEEFSRAVADLLELDPNVYSVHPDKGSLADLKEEFDGLKPGEVTNARGVTFTVANEEIMRECGYGAESDAVTVKISATKCAGGCSATECPYEKARRAAELFEQKYVCREHGKAHIALNGPGPAELSDMESLMSETLGLGEEYSVRLDAGAFSKGVVKTVITQKTGHVSEGPVFTPVFSVDADMSGPAMFTLCENELDAYKLIVHDGYSGSTGYGPWNAGQTESGWLLDTRADDGVRHGEIRDVSATESSQVIRKVNPTSKGVLNFRTGIEIKSGFDGAILDFRNTDEESV
ncbi:MAG: hypothetical protein IKG80_03505, partial [Clostridia bacterium]|nr:hypothetical protein [Clostridia bacterium]